MICTFSNFSHFYLTQVYLNIEGREQPFLREDGVMISLKNTNEDSRGPTYFAEINEITCKLNLK